MTIKFSNAVRNAILDSVETTIGPSAVLSIKSGAQPTACNSANSGTVLVTYNLSADWAAAASGGSKNFNALPLSALATGTGTAGHFRIFSNGGTCHWQGTVTVTDGGGDIEIDNLSIANNQSVLVTSFSLTAPNG